MLGGGRQLYEVTGIEVTIRCGRLSPRTTTIDSRLLKDGTAHRSRPENWASPESLGARRAAPSNIGRSGLFLHQRHIKYYCRPLRPVTVSGDGEYDTFGAMDALPGDSVVVVGEWR